MAFENDSGTNLCCVPKHKSCRHEAHAKEIYVIHINKRNLGYFKNNELFFLSYIWVAGNKQRQEFLTKNFNKKHICTCDEQSYSFLSSQSCQHHSSKGLPTIDSTTIESTKIPRKGGNYSHTESEYLIGSICDVLPISSTEWVIVQEMHSRVYGENDRTMESLQRKFTAIRNAKVPTGNAPCLIFFEMQKELLRLLQKRQIFVMDKKIST